MNGKKREKNIEGISGVGIAIAGRLRAAGYNEVLAIAVASPRDLAEECGISDRKAMDIIEGAKLCADIGGFEIGEDQLGWRRNVEYLTTGSESFDELMDGGLRNQSIVQLFGKKVELNTELCMRFAVNAILPKANGGLDSDVIIINSKEDTFDPGRIITIAESIGADPQEILKRIHISNTINTNHQIMVVEKATELAKEKKVKLLIVDSLTFHFKNEYKGRGMLAERQQMLNRHMCDLFNFATLNNAIVVVTNLAVDAQHAIKPWGGHVTIRDSTFLLFVRRGVNGRIIVRLVDSPNLPEGETVVSFDGGEV